MRPALVLTCEHGGLRVPARHRRLFQASRSALRSHRGWDQGALPLARELAALFGAPLVACTLTRLLVDANRSLGHPRLFSEWSRRLSPEEREELLARWWRPHREAVEALVRSHLASRRPVLHLSVHSFAPRWKSRRRSVDVGLLYDPARPLERRLAALWVEELRSDDPRLRVRRNQPYRGTADGLTKSLRERFTEVSYLGVELEVSQRFPQGPPRVWRGVRRTLGRSLGRALDRLSVS